MTATTAVLCIALAAFVVTQGYGECNVNPTGVWWPVDANATGPPPPGTPVKSIPGPQIEAILHGMSIAGGGPFVKPYLFLAPENTFGPELFSLETPVQNRVVVYFAAGVYGTTAAFHPTALDYFGQLSVSNSRRQCKGDLTDVQFEVYEQVAVLYAFLYGAARTFPAARESIVAGMAAIGLDYTYVEDDNLDASTPWGLARILVDEAQKAGLNDGWNADGSLSQTFNKLPYQDFHYKDSDGNRYRKYRKRPYNVEDGHFGWQPLQESDRKGYFTHQDHVTPFIGATARILGMDADAFDELSSPPPEHYGYTDDYFDEADYVLQQTRIMANNATQKVLVELFDNKFTSLLFGIQLPLGYMGGESLFDFWWKDIIAITVQYDAVVLVWREKVRYNRVRPTTVVHERLRRKRVETYGGPEHPHGSTKIKANEWQPYKRTMPHAEYPSASACICEAFTEAMRLATGDSDVIKTLNGDPMAIPFDWAAGSSIREPGANPPTDITVTFTKWSEVSHVCGESRIMGGMHFAGSVPAGQDLCRGNMSPEIVRRASLLKQGDPEGAMHDINDNEIHIRPFRREWY